MSRLGRLPKALPVLRSPCPTCYNDGVQKPVHVAPGTLAFQCPRGHEWHSSLEAVQRHTRWVGVIGRVGMGKIRQGEQ